MIGTWFINIALIATALNFGVVFGKPACSDPCSSSSNTCGPANTICVDTVDPCGQTYGGCFLDPTCTGGSTWPTFTAPPCDTATITSRGAEGTAITTVTIVTPTPPTSTCTDSACYDYFDNCGHTWGGCLPAPTCGGPVNPTFSNPYPPCTTSA